MTTYVSTWHDGHWFVYAYRKTSTFRGSWDTTVSGLRHWGPFDTQADSNAFADRWRDFDADDRERARRY